MPVEVLLKLVHGHLVCGLCALLAAGGGHGRGGFLRTCGPAGGRLTSSCLLRGLLLGRRFVGSILHDLVDAFGYVSGSATLLDCFLGRLRGCLLLALGAALDLCTAFGGLEPIERSCALFLDEDILDFDGGSVALLEREIDEFVALAAASLHDTSVNLGLFATVDCKLGNVGERLLFGCLGHGLLKIILI